MDGRDRRRYPRLEGHFSVDILNLGDDPKVAPSEVILPSEALDISKHGLRLKSNYNVSVGATLSVITYYRGRESVCLCHVVWKRKTEDGLLYGLFIQEWSKLDPILAHQLVDMEGTEDSPDTPRCPLSASSQLA